MKLVTKQTRLKFLTIFVMAILFALVAGCASTTGATKPEPTASGPALTAEKTGIAPIIDGKISEAAWQTAKPVTVTLKPEPGVEASKITLRALYDTENVYVSATYADSTPLKIGEAWGYDGASWTKGAYDDTLAFVWNMAGSLPGFDKKGMEVMTTPLRNGLDVFDFRIDNPSDALLHAKLDFWGW